MPMPTGKTTRSVSASVPFRAADYLHSHADIAVFLEEMLSDGDPRAVPLALRTVVDALGGMAKLAEKTGLSRETLYRTLSSNGNPRLDTLASILAAFGLTLSVQAITPLRTARRKTATFAAAKSSRPRPPRAKAK
jgi:probable addiction module antidote protein